MSREERFGERDLAFSRWHRAIPRDDYTWIDIDHCAYCHVCREPLYLIELAKDVGQAHKTTTVTRKVANGLSIPALLVLYKTDGDTITGFRIQRVAPTWSDGLASVEPRVLEEWIERERRHHVCSRAEQEAA